MSNILKFMMTLISLAFLLFLNTTAFAEKNGEAKKKSTFSPNRKISVR